MSKSFPAPHKPRYLQAEFLRARGSAVMWLPCAAFPLITLTYFLSGYTAPTTDATGVLMWQTMYLTGIAAPLMAIFALSAEQREAHARQGGTAWLPISQPAQRCARFCVVASSVFAFHVFNFGGSYLICVFAQRAHAERIAFLGCVAFLASLGVLGVASAVTRRTHLVMTVVVFIAWQIIGTVTAEQLGNGWVFSPMAWSVRAVLPILGVHYNGMALSPDDPLTVESPWVAVSLCIVLAVLGVIMAIITPEKSPGRAARRTKHGTPPALSPIDESATVPAGVYRPVSFNRRRPAHFHAAVIALNRALFTPAIASCLGLSILLLATVAVVYPASYVHGLWTFALLPIGCGVLPVLAWQSLSKAWALMYMENPRCASALLMWLGLCIGVMSTVASLAGVCAGGTHGDECRRWLLSSIVGFIICVASLLIAVFVSYAAALVLTVVLAIVSLTLGGDVLAHSALWMAAMPAWVEIADTSARLIRAIPTAVLLGVGLGFTAQYCLGKAVFKLRK
ncbi:hypothetical protein EML15_05020 [Corynebacterium sp. sy017]|uniref:hypothetical protein n=1 Tax=unclassified Corynebacterium TaxID=2624378 RepID=UPI001186C03B|nr:MULTISPECIES: hypothetical protein [unclassified Corynebacterium]MBP3088506.1 hypothetical protein [Corynebacterium sp. sy017]TSD91811.1 hypothetical protein ELY17_05020 [Corynebacterium sp. SY003]